MEFMTINGRGNAARSILGSIVVLLGQYTVICFRYKEVFGFRSTRVIVKATNF